MGLSSYTHTMCLPAHSCNWKISSEPMRSKHDACKWTKMIIRNFRGIARLSYISSDCEVKRKWSFDFQRFHRIWWTIYCSQFSSSSSFTSLNCSNMILHSCECMCKCLLCESTHQKVWKAIILSHRNCLNSSEETSDDGAAGTRYLNHKRNEIEPPYGLHSCQKHTFLVQPEPTSLLSIRP